jgi:flavin reductase (DIM6/NTAB) family NADH-FMN oxidoreductase RutF
MSGGGDFRIDAVAGEWREVYRRLVEIVVPRPIALVSSVDAEGRPNLAPFSFFTVVSANPPHVAFAPLRSGRSGAKKDTLRNVEAVGEFVVGVVTEELAERVNTASAALPHGVSEFAHAGLTPRPAELVRAPLIAESPVNVECRLAEIRTYGEGGGAGSLIVGRVVLVHVAERVRAADGRIDPELLRAVGRMGGEEWVRTRDRLTLPRPE